MTAIQFLNADNKNHDSVSSAKPLPVTLLDSAGTSTPKKTVSQIYRKEGTLTLNAGGYTANQVMGGKITIATGLPAGTVVSLSGVHLVIGAVTFTAGASNAESFLLFEGDPTHSTLTDTNAYVIDPQDWGLLVAQRSSAMLQNGATGSGPSFGIISPGTNAIVDASGNLYLVFYAGGTYTWTTPSAYWAFNYSATA